MATRFFLPSTGAADVSPAYGAWDETANAGTRLKCVTTKISSSMASVTVAKGTGTTRALVRQYVSAPLAAQTIAVGTIKGQIRALESAANDNLDLVSLLVRVCSYDGSTYRGTIIALGDYATALEFGTALTNRKIADGDATSSVVCQAGDRIVIEIGIKNSTSGTSVSGDLSFGDNSATDLAEDTTTTTANNPWVELSQTLVFTDLGYLVSAGGDKYSVDTTGPAVAGFARENTTTGGWRVVPGMTGAAIFSTSNVFIIDDATTPIVSVLGGSLAAIPRLGPVTLDVAVTVAIAGTARAVERLSAVTLSTSVAIAGTSRVAERMGPVALSSSQAIAGTARSTARAAGATLDSSVAFQGTARVTELLGALQLDSDIALAGTSLTVTRLGPVTLDVSIPDAVIQGIAVAGARLSGVSLLSALALTGGTARTVARAVGDVSTAEPVVITPLRAYIWRGRPTLFIPAE